MHSNHIFVIEISDAEGRSVGEVPLEMDWEPVVESARFEAMRRAELDQWAELAASRAEVLPQYDGKAPYAAGFRVVIYDGQQHAIASDYPAAWFDTRAKSAAAELAKQGKLKGGDRCSYKLLAFEQNATSSASIAGFEVEEMPAPPPVCRRDLVSLEASSTRIDNPAEGDLPVFLPRHVLLEAAEQTEAAGANETGGMLIGSLIRDTRSSGTAVVVSAQIPAPATEATSESLVFTPATWSGISDILALRNRKEDILIGFWHSHPAKYWCKACPPERRLICPLQQRAFLSASDLSLIDVLFPAPYQFALLVTNADDGLKKHALFGRWQGKIRRRGFFLFDDDAKAARGIPRGSVSKS